MEMKQSSGLALINSYSNEEYDEEDESNDSTDEDVVKDLSNSKLPSISSTQRLPLPSTITQLFKGTQGVNSAPEDDPNLHDGRIRSFPHNRGNWSTFVYVSYEPEVGFSDLLSQLKKCAACVGVELKTISEPHISLTRTVVLLHHWIDGFVSSVKAKLRHFPRFEIQLGAPAVYCNEERTRTFLGLQVVAGKDQLLSATSVLDQCLREFRLPPFYKDASFHMSVLWVVGDAQLALEAILPQLNAEFHCYLREHPHELNIDASQCFCKTGNKLFSFPLCS